MVSLAVLIKHLTLLMADKTLTINNNCWIIADESIDNDIDLQWFDDKYWLNQGRLLGARSGRGSAWMVKSDQMKMMLRHYYRGGIPAKFIKDKYFWTGLTNTRSFVEYHLLKKMYNIGLPVPKPVAALVCKAGFFYQANILIEYIPHESTFAKVLKNNSYNNEWQNIGTCIAQFHKNGFFHADLNAHNILIAEDKIYLIDFDHSSHRKPQTSWQSANLKRLKRSIDKLSNNDHIETINNNWQNLLHAYSIVINE